MKQAKREVPNAETRFHGHAERIWLLSDGRSGSTWISGLLNYDTTLTEYFEPLHSRFNPCLRNEPQIPVYDTGDLPAAYAHLYDELFSGRFRHRRSGPKTRGDAGVLVKDINALMIAAPILERDHRIRAIFLVRHPLDVAASKTTLTSWRWGCDAPAILHRLIARGAAPSKYTPLADACSNHFQSCFLVWGLMHQAFLRAVGGRAITCRYPLDFDGACDLVSTVRRIDRSKLAGSEAFQSVFQQRSRTDSTRRERYLPSKSDRAFAQQVVHVLDLAPFLLSIGFQPEVA